MSELAPFFYAALSLAWLGQICFAAGRASGRKTAEKSFQFFVGKNVLEMADSVKSRRKFVGGDDSEIVIYDSAVITSPSSEKIEVRVYA